MDFELWYLAAVPLLFAAGWFLRGYDAKQGSADSHGLPNNYFRGLSLLLSNEPDKAIDAFIEVVKLDSETIELHHALGNLFCRRGEFERAIRIHTHLVSRADLAEKERLLALSELAEDYLKAGIFDKASECYAKLAEHPSYRREALQSLLNIRGTEHDWAGALETAGRLEKESSEDRSSDKAHFRCEMAEEALKRKNPEGAAAEVQKALSEKSSFPRALILEGDIAVLQGNPAEAIRCWEQAKKVSPEHFPLIAARLSDAYDRTGNAAAAKAVIAEALEKAPSAEVIEIAMKRALRDEGQEAAARIMSQALSSHPTLGVLSAAMEFRKLTHPEDEQLQGLSAMLRKESDRQGRYQCRRCGFLSHSYLWKCPGCGGWDTYPTLRVQDASAKKRAG